MTTTKRTGAKGSRPAPGEVPDRKTLVAGEPPAETANTSSSRKPWKKKSVAEQILGQLDKLREEVAAKEQSYLQAKQQLDKLEALREVLENQ